jgi:hypothetical protein
MKIVKEAVEKTNGIISHKMMGSYFTVTVMLPMENEPGGRGQCHLDKVP